MRTREVITVEASAAIATSNRRSASGGADLLLLFLATIVINLPMLAGTDATTPVFRADLVAHGDWWRLLTHPFAHVSAYHLLLDAGAFFLLYHGLRDERSALRLPVFLGAAAGSLALASLHPAIRTSGLCGLSGAAHGLMAATGLVMAAQEDPAIRRAGLWATGLVMAKSLFEACTGWVLFSDLHLGDIGRPNPLCHLGGTLGGMSAWWVVRRLRIRFRDPMPDVEGNNHPAPS